MDKQKERKHKGRYSYLNDFKLNDENEYEYRGDIHQLDLSADEKKNAFTKLVSLIFALVAVIILSGCIPYRGMRGAFYVIIPYVFEVVFSLLLVPCVYTIIRNDTLRDYQYKKSVEKLLPYSGVIIINSIIGVFSSVIYAVINGYEPLSETIGYLLCKIAAFFLAKTISGEAGRIKYRKIQEKDVENE